MEIRWCVAHLSIIHLFGKSIDAFKCMHMQGFDEL